MRSQSSILYTILFVLVGGALLFWLFSTWHKPNVYQQQQSRKNDYTHKIQKLDHELRNARVGAEARRKKLAHAKKLAKLYRDGVPDKYDTNGRKIKGIAPVADKAISYYRMSSNLGDPYGLFKIAKIYHYGMHNLKPDWEKALSIYKKVAEESSTPSSIRTKAVDAIKELQKNIQSRNVHNWLNLPYKPPENNKYQYHQGLQQAHAPNGIYRNRRNRLLRATIGGTQSGPAVPIGSLFRSQRGSGNGGVVQPQPNDHQNDHQNDHDEEELPEHQRNDLHNVHDSGVLGTIRRSINNLKENTKITIPLTQTLKQIRDMISQNTVNDKKTDACVALDSIERSFLPLSSTNIREVDALHMVWNRIHDPTNKDNQKVLKENLASELAECIEHGKPVCSTGRFTRILDSLNGVDRTVQIKPMYALKSEMMDKCAKIRKELYDALPESEKVHVDSINENESQTHFHNTLTAKIKQELHRDYVANQVLTQDQLDAEVNKWIDVI